MTDNLAMRRAAMNLLARRDHSSFELIQKLAPRFPDKPALKEVINQLHQDGLQDDLRFAESFVRYRAASGYGAERISQELKQKGVDAENISKAFDNNELDWQEILHDVYRKKYGDHKPSDLNEKAKRTRFLVSRGFSFAAINALWRSSG